MLFSNSFLQRVIDNVLDKKVHCWMFSYFLNFHSLLFLEIELLEQVLFQQSYFFFVKMDLGFLQVCFLGSLKDYGRLSIFCSAGSLDATVELVHEILFSFQRHDPWWFWRFHNILYLQYVIMEYDGTSFTSQFVILWCVEFCDIL